MSLYQKVRPTTFDAVAGNADVVDNLRTLAAKSDPPHAFLITGPSGCGKTTLGRNLAVALGVSLDDVLAQTGNYREIDSAQFRGIDTIRELREAAAYLGIGGGRRVFLIDEVHRLPALSQDALLKTLEDAPDHAFFVLCTTEPDSLLETIKSRCSTHAVQPLSEKDMVKLLYGIAASEGEKLGRPLLAAIYEKTGGKSRAAIQLLEKVLAAPEAAREGIVKAELALKEKVDSLAKALMSKTGWRSVATILAEVKDDDVEGLRRGMLAYASKALIRDENQTALLILDEMVSPFYQSGVAGLIHACFIIAKG